MTDRLAELNINLAGKHLGVVVRAAKSYQAVPLVCVRAEYLRKAQAESRVLRSLAERSGDPSLLWAAGEAEDVIQKIMVEH